MGVDDLRRRVGTILAAEEREPADWPEVERLSDELLQQLRAEPDTECPDVVTHFLEDADVRAKDEDWAAYQKEEIRRFIETGEYSDSRAPLWTCPLILVLIGGLVLWVVL